MRADAGTGREPRPTLQQLLDGMPERHLAWPMLLCTLLAAVPGLQLGWVCAPALFWIARALWNGQTAISLPARLAGQRISGPAAARLLRWVDWLHRQMRHWCRPRWPATVRHFGGRQAALLVAGMAGLILLPLPGSNLLPATALIALAAGLHVRDGLAIAAAWMLAGASVALLAAVTWLGAAWIGIA